MYSMKRFIIFVVSLHTFFVSFSIHAALEGNGSEVLAKAHATKEQINQTVEWLKQQYRPDFLKNCATLLSKKSSTADRAQALTNVLKDDSYNRINLQAILILFEKADSDSLKKIFGQFSQSS